MISHVKSMLELIIFTNYTTEYHTFFTKTCEMFASFVAVSEITTVLVPTMNITELINTPRMVYINILIRAFHCTFNINSNIF